MCHLANISYRLGAQLPCRPRIRAFGDDREAYETLARMEEHLQANSVPLDQTNYQVGRRLTIDAHKMSRFVNDDEANRMLTREYLAKDLKFRRGCNCHEPHGEQRGRQPAVFLDHTAGPLIAAASPFLVAFREVWKEMSLFCLPMPGTRVRILLACRHLLSLHGGRAMLTSYLVRCPHFGCDWFGSLLPSRDTDSWARFGAHDVHCGVRVSPLQSRVAGQGSRG